MRKIILFLFVMVCSVGYAQEVMPVQEKQIYSLSGIDKQPEYPGGIGAFYSYVQKNMRIPEIKGDLNVTIYTTFIINADGTVTDIDVVRDPGHGLGEEAKKVLASDKTVWKPGVLNGKPVRVKYALPIKINMKDPKPHAKRQ